MTCGPTPELVFAGDRLQARLWRPDPQTGPQTDPQTATLYVTFRHRVPDPGRFSDAGAVRHALTLGLAHLHIQSRWNDWYLNAETTALEAALRQLRTRFSAARAFGYSMGGYGALRFSAALALDQALVVSPQFTLDPGVLPDETRYPEAGSLDHNLGDLRAVAKPDLAGVVVVDPLRRLDRQHAALIAEAMSRMRLARLAFGGHPATTALREAGGFCALQLISMTAPLNPGPVIALHRRLRAASPSYWNDRAKECLQRGRLTAAEIALDRAEALGPSDGS